MALLETPAVAAGEGAISGTVLDASTGRGVAGSCVTAGIVGYDAEGYEIYDERGRAVVGDDGRYTITGLPPRDDYQVVFRDCGAGGFYRYVTETWPDVRGVDRVRGEPVAVAPSSMTTGIDERLERIGVIDVVVLDTSGRRVFGIGGATPVGHDDPGDLPGSAGEGRFPAAPGPYRVQGGNEWFRDRPTVEEADLVHVRPGVVTRVEIRLDPEAVIEGSIVDAATGRRRPVRDGGAGRRPARRR